MASKGKNKLKGVGADSSLGKMGQRMLTTKLREERIAERDLQEKLRAISEKEHKAMVRLGCDSLDLRHDLTLQRSSSPLPWERENSFDSLEGTAREGTQCGTEKLQRSPVRPRLARKAVSVLTQATKQEPELCLSECKCTNNIEINNNNSSSSNNNSQLTRAASPSIALAKTNEKRGRNNNLKVNHLSLTNSNAVKAADIVSESSLPKSPRLLKRRPVSDIGCRPIVVNNDGDDDYDDDDDDEVFIEQIPLRQGAANKRHVAPKPPSTPPPVRRNLSSLSTARPSSARTPRSRTPVRGGDCRLDLPQHLTIQRPRSPSPSPVRLSPDMTMANLSRRGSAPPKIDASTLPTKSLLRKVFNNDVNQNLRPVSPDALRKRLSSTDEELKDRVSVFLKSLQNK